MKKIQLPISETEIRKLRIGDDVAIFGEMVTARDAAHKYMLEKWPRFVDDLIRDKAIYHCGPVIKEENGEIIAVSAGPTTSIREEPYEHEVIAHYRPRIIIGKGGMGPTTLQAMKEYGAVYVHATGGAASVIAKSIIYVHKGYKRKELGDPEAFWKLEVRHFTGVVTMDSHGDSLHDIVEQRSKEKFYELIS
ncbi:MAG: fumarate hydratase C-terminal domain-containing protein [Deltaproteobacteria bacterium]|nr:fumarate hydratase C-terminal domain-containing protein [Deltaproteobacteria bacterium]MBN2671740.1 fumarate hydratase C-terminal domain-containing protein [Deltaproteobacteria bacterium]